MGSAECLEPPKPPTPVQRESVKRITPPPPKKQRVDTVADMDSLDNLDKSDVSLPIPSTYSVHEFWRSKTQECFSVKRNCEMMPGSRTEWTE